MPADGRYTTKVTFSNPARMSFAHVQTTETLTGDDELTVIVAP